LRSWHWGSGVFLELCPVPDEVASPTFHKEPCFPNNIQNIRLTKRVDRTLLFECSGPFQRPAGIGESPARASASPLAGPFFYAKRSRPAAFPGGQPCKWAALSTSPGLSLLQKQTVPEVLTARVWSFGASTLDQRGITSALSIRIWAEM
jgi:hypothetical protein